MNEDKLYSFIMRGELTKVSLNSTDIVSRHSSSDAFDATLKVDTKGRKNIRNDVI